MEVPAEVEFDFTLTSTIAEAVLHGPGEWIGNGVELAALASVVREKVKPLIAARVRAEAEAAEVAALQERDEAEEWADKLADALGGAAIGGHSSANNPWQNALDFAAERDARVRAEERQRAAAEIEAARVPSRPENDAFNRAMMSAAAVVRRGSAVPVATPGPEAVAWAVRPPDGGAYVPGDTELRAGTLRQAEAVVARNQGRGGTWAVVPLVATEPRSATPHEAEHDRYGSWPCVWGGSNECPIVRSQPPVAPPTEPAYVYCPNGLHSIPVGTACQSYPCKPAGPG